MTARGKPGILFVIEKTIHTTDLEKTQGQGPWYCAFLMKSEADTIEDTPLGRNVQKFLDGPEAKYQPSDFDVFISYASKDSAIAHELRCDLEKNSLKCYMAEEDIQVGEEWLDSIRAALVGSRRVLVVLTPRSINRPWVLMETGAAWALGKPLIPALSQVDANDLIDPIRRHQARMIETTAQRRALVRELTGT